MDARTVAVYEREAERWARARPARHLQEAAALVARRLPGLPIVDLGCGHGPYLSRLGPDPVGLDAAGNLLRRARAEAPGVRLVRGDLTALPFRDRSFGGAWGRNSYVHVPAPELPLALAGVHWALAPGAPLILSMLSEHRRAVDDFPGRAFTFWEADRLADVVVGAGFEVAAIQSRGDLLWLEAGRARTLPDTVDENMRILVCGLNPSLTAADAGFGYAGATNRFWPAATRAGLIRHPRRPLLALRRDGVGMTDLVKRATRRAAEISNDEFRAGLGRVGALVRWLRPRLVLFVGLTGWRTAVDRSASPGLQPERLGGAMVYLMPSTSGLNAATGMAELVGHFAAAAALAGPAAGPDVGHAPSGDLRGPRRP